jgi:hypothetical protein
MVRETPLMPLGYVTAGLHSRAHSCGFSKTSMNDGIQKPNLNDGEMPSQFCSDLS